MRSETVTIHYRRPPDRLQIFHQRLIHRADDHVVTFLESAPFDRPVYSGDQVILEPGAPIVWFTYRGRWHDIGRFHLADGTFTGVYANILTPVAGFETREWDTTDLFLDVWVPPEGPPSLLDEDEFAEAVERGSLTAEVAQSARAEAGRLLDAAGRGEWPGPEVEHWTLERVRSTI